jgi:ATP-binding cassette subfamily B protein
MKFKSPITNLFKYTWKYSKGRRHWILGFLILYLIANIIYLFEPILIGRMFNSIQFNETDSQLLDFIIKNLLFLFLLTVSYYLIYGPGRIIENRNAYLAHREYKLDMFKKVLYLKAVWHQEHHSGDTIDKIYKASDGLRNFSSHFFVFVQHGVRLIGSFSVLIWFNVQIGILALFFLIFGMWIVVLFDRKIRKYLLKIIKKENFLAAGIHDLITNVFTIITLRLRPKAVKEINSRSFAPYKIFRIKTIVEESKWFLMTVLVILLTVGTLIGNAYYSYTTKGVILIGTLFALYRYLNLVMQSFYVFGMFYGEIVKNEASVIAAEVINDEYKLLEHKEKKYLPPAWQKLELQKINFKYKEDSNTRFQGGKIENVNIKINRKSRIALVGESGSGKSTIMLLMRGLYDINSGTLSVDNNLQKDGLRQMSEHVTLIPQEPDIFDATIEDNITMGIKTEKKKLDLVLDVANFKAVAARYKNGLKTNVMEKGVSLSGGEKQRLALARGLLAGLDSDILLLDEPTSSVDTQNETEIYEKIFMYYQDKTIISSIHRLHLLNNFDYIYYFKDGKILLEGALEELLKDKVFKERWDNYFLNSKGQKNSHNS